MSRSRRSAWALIAVFVVGLFGPAGVAVAAAPQCTGWTDQFHPPTTIRVKRKSGPARGTVQVVDFWTYVATVLKAEYTTGASTSPTWLRVGAITVKQFAWYYAMHWRGGNLDDGTCYDVKDSPVDQIYHPERLVNGVWLPANAPTPAIFQAMAETWHITLRKSSPTTNTSRFPLTGYRAGRKRPCGSDARGLKIKQKSLRDCLTKGLDLEEVLRKYFEPNLELVDAREHDILADQGQWLGDVGVLSPSGSSTAWRVYPGQPDGFGQPVGGAFAIDPAAIVSQGAGDVTGDNLADLVMLASGRLLLAVANGSGYADPTGQDLPVPADRMLVADFDGDLLADVGLLRSTPGAPAADQPATLVVMRGTPGGAFGGPMDWWRGALDLSSQAVLAGDVNGDGKADLIMRDGSAGVRYWVAPSFASCADFSVRGPCALVPGIGLDVAQLWFDQPGWSAADVKQTLSDFNRDGRSDLIVVARDGGGIDVLGLRARAGSFADPAVLWQADLGFDEVLPLGLDVNPDGLGDLALLNRDGATTAVRWLQTVSNGGAMSPTTPLADPGLAWNDGANRLY